jgi:hypothetical protein
MIQNLMFYVSLLKKERLAFALPNEALKVII